MLYHQNWESSFEVHTDASKKGCGAMLAQRQNGCLRPVRFSSRSFNPTESRWPTAHQELFAVKWALETFRHYLIGRKFKVITDHANLKFLASIAPQNSILARWCLSLAEFHFQIEHRPGKENVVPDTLRRALGKLSSHFASNSHKASLEAVVAFQHKFQHIDNIMDTEQMKICIEAEAEKRRSKEIEKQSRS
eukprot:Seg5528.2 transcript_id=Seg5528.2/GoldUCD/mRNA.D3Y31 product="Retrovirus-related Pol polyprotein from transposon 412" pseudo=true protein_id=Seg5528.2/GoldUCD/D3Y31